MRHREQQGGEETTVLMERYIPTSVLASGQNWGSLRQEGGGENIPATPRAILEGSKEEHLFLGLLF